MVQRKAPDKPKSSIEHKWCHGRLEREPSSYLQQDTRTRGGGDLKKKLKKVKSMKVSDFDGFKHSPMDIQLRKTAPSKKITYTPIRNYMKPTSSSDARKEKLQVTVTSPTSYDKKKGPRSSTSSNSSSAGSASPRAVKVLSRQSSLKPVKFSMKKSSVVAMCGKKNVNRATCSSTLKDSKFPPALELNHGATEAEGTTKMRVCPYTYCSLNGHMHEPLPPLERFISARRNLLKTQKSLKVKRLLSFKPNLSEKVGEMIDDEPEVEIGENPSDLFIEIYTMPQEEAIGEINCDEICILEEKCHEQYLLDEVEYSMETMPQMNESSDINFEYDYGMDQNSEFSQDEVDDVMTNFLEDAEFDHERITAQIDCVEDGEIRKSKSETMDVNWEEAICFLPDNMEISECPDELFSLNTANSYAASEEQEEDLESEEENSNVIEKEDSDISEFNSQSINDEIQIQSLRSEMMICQSDESSVGDESRDPEKELLDSSNGTDRNILNVSANDYKEIDGCLSSRWNITKERTTEEFEQVKEFNPRPPNFLPFEPDPEEEKVDLRHQIMDERRNSEEWMIDYALQQAVTKLGSSRKKKVALLVEAFETVIPLPMCEKPLGHGTSTFNHMSFIQACN